MTLWRALSKVSKATRLLKLYQTELFPLEAAEFGFSYSESNCFSMSVFGRRGPLDVAVFFHLFCLLLGLSLV